MQERQLSARKLTWYPLLDPQNYVVTSDETDDYNCVGWAAIPDDPFQWWPLPDAPEYYWPPGARRDETIEAFIEGFGTLRYQVCEAGDLEPGVEKIAIYALRGVPTHVARQLSDGRWTSKLGVWEDIEHHASRDLAGGRYGSPEVFMSRLVGPEAETSG